MADFECRRCGKPTLAGDRRVVAVRALPSGGRERLYAHPECERAAPRLRRCLGFECNQSFSLNGGPGRPAQYHSEACRKATDRALRRAQVLVARGKLPRGSAEIRQATSLVEFLWNCWGGRAAEVRAGRPFPAIDPAPAPELVRAASRFLTALSGALESARQNERNAAREERAKAAAAELDRARTEGVAADQAWRVEVLKREAAEADKIEVF